MADAYHEVRGVFYNAVATRPEDVVGEGRRGQRQYGTRVLVDGEVRLDGD